jgi:hypothetical protein
MSAMTPIITDIGELSVVTVEGVVVVAIRHLALRTFSASMRASTMTLLISYCTGSAAFRTS